MRWRRWNERKRNVVEEVEREGEECGVRDGEWRSVQLMVRERG